MQTKHYVMLGTKFRALQPARWTPPPEVYISPLPYQWVWRRVHVRVVSGESKGRQSEKSARQDQGHFRSGVVRGD